MKRFLTLMVAMLLVSLMAACGGGTATTHHDRDETVTVTTSTTSKPPEEIISSATNKNPDYAASAVGDAPRPRREDLEIDWNTVPEWLSLRAYQDLESWDGRVQKFEIFREAYEHLSENPDEKPFRVIVVERGTERRFNYFTYDGQTLAFDDPTLSDSLEWDPYFAQIGCKTLPNWVGDRPTPEWRECIQSSYEGHSEEWTQTNNSTWFAWTDDLKYQIIVTPSLHGGNPQYAYYYVRNYGDIAYAAAYSVDDDAQSLAAKYAAGDWDGGIVRNGDTYFATMYDGNEILMWNLSDHVRADGTVDIGIERPYDWVRTGVLLE